MLLNWKDVDQVRRDLETDFVVTVQKSCGAKAVANPDKWSEMLFDGHNSLETRQFWRSMSQSLQLDLSQLRADKINQAEFERLVKSLTTQLFESTKSTIENNADVYCHPGFYLDRRGFMITMFWYVEFARF